jgi:uncharacterized membrane protein YhhN
VPDLALTSLAALAIAAPLDWWSVAVHGRRREWVLKPLVLVLLIVTAWLLGAPESSAGWWLLAALGLSLVGDVALLSDSDPRFVVGLGSFLLAHVAFVVAFAHLGMPRADLGLVGLGLVAVMVVAVGRRVVPAARAEGGAALAVAVTAYISVIGAMVVAAWATGHPLAALGATVFMLSDAVLALDRFVRARRFGSLTVMVTYHLAQVLIVLGLLSS